MKNLILFFYLTPLFYISCNTNAKKTDNEGFSNALMSKVDVFKSELNMPNNFTFDSYENTLKIEMEIDTLYYTDVISNDIIIHLLLIGIFDYTKNYDTIKVKYYYKWDKSNVRDLSLSRSELDEKEWITKNTEEGKNLGCVIKDVLLNLKYSTLNSYNIVLSDFKKLDDKKLLSNYNSFWDYIVLYCESNESNKEDLKLFYELTQYEIYNVDGSFILKLIENGCKCNDVKISQN